jgi:glycosyltransferase involved in cell wall biosynthesis
VTKTKQQSVLIIVENLPVPFDTRVWKEARALRNHGFEVSVLCPRGKGYKRIHEVLEGVHIYRHPMPPEGDSPLGYVWEYGCALFWEFVFAWWIFMTRGFDIIQGCNPPDDIFLVALPFKLFGVSYIFDHHDAIPELYLSKYERRDLFFKVQTWLEKLTYLSASVVIATNESYKELAIKRGRLDEQDVFVVRNGPDLATFFPVPSQPALKYGKSYLVGYVGTMSIQEGLDILIDVAANIRSRGRSDIHFTCVGGGPGLPALRQMAAEKNLEDMFNFTGRVPDKDLLEVLSTSDVCVNPDRPCEMNDISTMIKIAEYMALSKPVVQFNLKEGRFTAGDASLYSDGEDLATDFADKILWLLDRPEERERMGRFGRMRVEQQLAWGYSIGNLIAAYERAIQKRAPMQHNSSTATDAISKSAPGISGVREQGTEEFTPEQMEG